MEPKDRKRLEELANAIEAVGYSVMEVGGQDQKAIRSLLEERDKLAKVARLGLEYIKKLEGQLHTQPNLFTPDRERVEKALQEAGVEG